MLVCSIRWLREVDLRPDILDEDFFCFECLVRFFTNLAIKHTYETSTYCVRLIPLNEGEGELPTEYGVTLSNLNRLEEWITCTRKYLQISIL